MDQHSVIPLTIGLMWRGDPDAPADPKQARHAPLLEAFAALGVNPKVIHYSDERAATLVSELTALDGLLVWVDPISEAGDRSRLDPLLRQVADAGVYVSADPEVIAKMGVKSVLYLTKALGWGVDTRLYRSVVEMQGALAQSLASGPRVVKRNRGNGGIGVWKVSQVGDLVEVLEARRGAEPGTLPLADFCATWADAFERGGCVVDQPFQPRLSEGMIRCYVCQDRVVGYGHQLIKALTDAPGEPGPRIMHEAEAPLFQPLRRAMETDWIPGLRRRLHIGRARLPALWDADFLYGPKDEEGRDTYVLCEINVSSVAPYPPSAVAPVAEYAAHRAWQARHARNADCDWRKMIVT